MNQTNIKGTPGQVRVISIDPNNVRISLDTNTGSGTTIKPGTYNMVTVDSTGRVVSGIFVAPEVTQPPLNIPSASNGIDSRTGDYGGGTPSWIPSAGQIGLAIDIGPLGGNRMWWYFGGTWN